MANMLIKLFNIFISHFKSVPKTSNITHCWLQNCHQTTGEKDTMTAKFYNAFLYFYIVTSFLILYLQFLKHYKCNNLFYD